MPKTGRRQSEPLRASQQGGGGNAIWDSTLDSTALRAKALRYFDPERRACARTYRPLRHFAFASSLLFDALFLGLLAFGPLGRYLEAAVSSLPAPLNKAAWASAAAALRFVLLLPLAYITSYRWPRRFGLVHHKPLDWLKDRLVDLALSVLLVSPAALLFHLLLARAGHLWWLIAALLSFAFTAFVTLVAPVWLMPLYNKFWPLVHGELAKSIEQMARRAGTRVTGVFVMDMSRRTSAANAMLAGIGRTRRMILADTLLRDFSEDEIKVVIAHELGHHYHNHIQKALLASGVSLPPILWVVDKSSRIAAARQAVDVMQPVFLGVVMFSAWVMNLLTTPFQSALSRWFERQSDEFATSLTALYEPFCSMMARLLDKSLGDIEPPLLLRLMFYTHPPAVERIMAALSRQQAASLTMLQRPLQET